MDKVNELYFEILNNDLLEDRREYDQEELARSYPDLDVVGVDLLYRLIQANFIPFDHKVTFRYGNSDDLVQELAKQLALDIQMEIDDRDIGANMPTREWLARRLLINDLVGHIDIYRTSNLD